MYCIYLYRIVLLGLYHQLELYEIHRWMIQTSAPIKPCFPHWQNIIAYHSFPLCWVVCVKHTTCYTQTNIGPYKNPPPIIDLWQCCFLWKTHRVGWLCSGTCLYTVQPSQDQKLQDYGHRKQKQTALTLDCSSFIYPKISWWWLKKNNLPYLSLLLLFMKFNSNHPSWPQPHWRHVAQQATGLATIQGFSVSCYGVWSLPMHLLTPCPG